MLTQLINSISRSAEGVRAAPSRAVKVVLPTAVATVTLAAAAVSTASPTADRQELAFARDGDIYTVHVDRTNLRRLIGTRAFEHSPAFSPDGSKILYVSESGGNADVYVADADGGNTTRLTRSPGGDYNPSWSPDGTRIAFASNRGGLFKIYVMDLDGTGARRVAPVRSSGGGSFTPAWSPNGRLIAFSSSADTPENTEIYVVRPDGTGLTRLTRTKGDSERLGDDAWPSWSPDGKRIVFSSNRTGNGDVWIMRPDGTGQKRIAGLPGRDDWSPAFAPDGSRIAFHSLDPLGRTQLYLVAPDGTHLRKLGIAGEDPTWRP